MSHTNVVSVTMYCLTGYECDMQSPELSKVIDNFSLPAACNKQKQNKAKQTKKPTQQEGNFQLDFSKS